MKKSNLVALLIALTGIAVYGVCLYFVVSGSYSINFWLLALIALVGVSVALSAPFVRRKLNGVGSISAQRTAAISIAVFAVMLLVGIYTKATAIKVIFIILSLFVIVRQLPSILDESTNEKARKYSRRTKGVLPRIGVWLKRMFFGASRDLYEEDDEETVARNLEDVERIVSPFRQIVHDFFERKYAVVALVLLICMFIFVFIGPMFTPQYTDSYNDTTQANIAPGFSMMSVPSELEKDVKYIDSYSTFSVGLSNSGKVYVWGSTQLGTTGIDMAVIPEEVQNAKIEHVAAGRDHIVAIDADGKVYAWGSKTLGQFGKIDSGTVIPMPDELIENGIPKDKKIKKLTCGYQVTAILFEDGTSYVWGNEKAVSNLATFASGVLLSDIDFTLNYGIGINMDGTNIVVGVKNLYNKVRPNISGSATKLSKYLNGRKLVGVSCANNNVCYLLDDGSVCFAGDFYTTDSPLPEEALGKKIVSVGSGSRHHTVLCADGSVYSCGSDVYGQADAPDNTNIDRIYVGAFQSYGVDSNNELAAKWGLRGYLFGTNKNGADIFMRIMNGGKMTVTIGAVAVVISTIIGVIVGCLSGYFGGKVDMILMRVTEIFAAIPFLPFAMILSAILSQQPWEEDTKIFMIMVILGLLSWTGLARLIRGQVLVARENEYVTAAKSMGVKESKIAFKHILPNVMSVIIVTLTLDFAGCMLTESSLSYLGFGVNEPRPTWGNMLNGANNLTVMNYYWWQWAFTALFLAITTICINIIGDTLRDVMDPKSKADR